MQSPQPSEESYDTLVTAFQQRLYFFIRSMVYNKDDARDILQDVNIVLLKKRTYYVPGTNFKSWAFTIARFECLNYLKKYKKSVTVELNEELTASLSQQAEEICETMPESIAALNECLNEVPSSALTLLRSRYHSKATLEETATEQNTSVGALKQKLFRLRSRLKKCIELRLSSQT